MAGDQEEPPYWRFTQGELDRLVSWLDREPLSKTYGCFDRVYWAWKFTDFPGARFQEGVYSLAHLVTTPLAGNVLYGEDRVLDWIRAGLDFWCRIQYRDGSFDEAYPFEHSLAATAFSSFYVGEALLRLTGQAAFKTQDVVFRALAKAGDWLCRNDEQHGVLSNHLAAAAAALHVIHRLTGEDRFDRRCRHYLQRIYDHQSSEGWYEEYGGADPGYQTHATFYLARLWQSSGDAVLLKSLERSQAFLKHFIHPNGTLGGEYASRNTEFYFPAGLEILAPVLPDAARIARFMRAGIAQRTTVGLWAMDAQNFLPLLNNYLSAAENAAKLEDIGGGLPWAQEGEWLFPDAGLLVRSTAGYYAVLGVSKGGVLKIFQRSPGRLALSDCGYWAVLDGGVLASSQSLDRRCRWQREAGAVSVEGDFVRVNQRLLSSYLLIPFRMFSLTLGRMGWAARWLKDRLVRLLVSRRRLVPLRLIRRVRFGPGEVSVSDEVALTGPLSLTALRRGAKFATIHMGSSRYFQPEELDLPAEEVRDWAGELLRRGTLHIDWSWNPVRAKDDPRP